MVFYLKYRPQKLADLDLAEVREGLARALFSKEIPHAFLFAGPRGTGKTSAARILAKAINCEEKASQGKMKELASEPCNQCDSCRSITAGINLDVLEIDGASNRGIDDIRNLREKIKLAPAKLKYKVYIIDEAHMLTSEAFNALLKTLEEPPKHAIFVLCTTEPQKLPPTIISRCLRFNFRKAKIKELMAGLEKIVKAEKLRVQKGVLEKIAQAADGSFRDSQKILEQLSFEKGKITVEKVNGILGQVRGAGPEKLLEYLVKKDARGAILEIGRIVKEGVNLRWYVEGLLEMLRVGLLAKLGIEAAADQSSATPPKALKTLKISEIKNLIEIFSRAAMELKTAIISQLPLEMAVVEWCQNSKQSCHSEEQSDEESLRSFSADSADQDDKRKNLAPMPHVSRASGSNLSFDSVCRKWPQVLKAVGPKNHSVQAFLRAARPKDFDGKDLVLEVFYEFHKSQLESDKCRRLVEETVEVVLKTPVRIKCVLGEKPRPKESNPPSLPPSPSSPSSPSFSPSKQSQEEKYHLPLSSQSEEDSDIMKVAEEIFGKPVD